MIFSAPVFNPSNYTSCEFGIFGGPVINPGPLVHNWKLMVRGAAMYYVDLRVGAHAVNVADEGGSVTFTVTPAASSTVIATRTVQQRTDMPGDVIEILPLTLVGGTIYDLKVEVNPPATNTLRTARHYKLGAVQPTVELGIDGSGVNYFERRNVLQINADAAETGVMVLVSVDDPAGPGDVPDQAGAYDYTVLDQFGGVIATSTPGTLISTSTPVMIGFAHSGGFIDPFTLFTLGNGHTVAMKATGTDGGFYIKECNAVPQPFHLDLSPDFDVNPVGTNHTVTATVTGTAGPGFPIDVPVPAAPVNFEIVGGPNTGASGVCGVNPDCNTDINGQVSWTYAGSAGVGIDTIEASTPDELGFPSIGDHVNKEWIASGPPDEILDHFLGYKVKEVPPKFVERTVSLADQFVTGEYIVKKPDMLFVPANKNGEGINDPNTHLKRYEVKATGDTPKKVEVEGVIVTNQFGQFVVEVEGPHHLLVPTTKAIASPGGTPPDLPDGSVDHFLCYKVRGADVDIVVSVADQFATRKYEIGKAIMLCNPVEKSVEDQNGNITETPIQNPNAHLMCFKAAPFVAVRTNNQFGPEKLIVEFQDRELCVPSSKTLQPEPPSSSVCDTKVQSMLLRYIGPNILGATIELVSKSGQRVVYSGVDLISGVTELSDPGQNGFTIDATTDGETDLGSKTSIFIDDVEEVVHTSCSTPFVADAPAPLNEPKGDPSSNWFVVGFTQK